MKVTRSYWLGLGSGLILSAILTLAFSPLQKSPDAQPIVNQAAPPPLTGEINQTAPLVQSSEPNSTPSIPPDTQIPTQVDRDFVVPKGASAEKIADLLFVQDFIKDKVSFLERVHKMRVERRFRAGSFSLSSGLSEDDLIKRLIK